MPRHPRGEDWNIVDGAVQPHTGILVVQRVIATPKAAGENEGMYKHTEVQRVAQHRKQEFFY